MKILDVTYIHIDLSEAKFTPSLLEYNLCSLYMRVCMGVFLSSWEE